MKDAKLFSDTHSYIKNAHKGAKQAVDNFISNILLPLENFAKTKEMFKTYKQYENGGKVLVPKNINKKASDYKSLINIANLFAKDGKVVRLTPTVHFKSIEYEEIYGSLIGTVYERKCPDLQIDGLLYEFENYTPPFRKKKISHMISQGTKQAPRIIINNTKGASDRFIRDNIYKRIKDKTFNMEIEEVWLYEKGELRLFYKNGGE